MTPVIEISGLRKTYGSLLRNPHHAVDGLDMIVEPNQVHGFLGPNGSGKTTTLRALLGLTPTQEGSMRVLGHSVPGDLSAVIHRIGAVVEAPKFFGNISARNTLQLLARSVGIPMSRVEEVLEQVGLIHYGHYLVGSYSLGMKQRLAVAQALLKKPDLLILDEPANGLDPAGIHQMRTLLRTLATEFNTTVLVSSHLLSEAQLLCDSVTIISQGRRIQTASMSDLTSASQSNELLVDVKASDVDAAMAHLDAIESINVSQVDGQLQVMGAEDPALVTETLARHDIFLTGLAHRTTNLEEVYLQLTSGRGLEYLQGGE